MADSNANKLRSIKLQSKVNQSMHLSNTDYDMAINRADSTISESKTGQNFFGIPKTESVSMSPPKRQIDKRAQFGQSTLTLNSNDERGDIARKTNHSRNSASYQTAMNAQRRKKVLAHSLDFQEFKNLIGYELGERPKIIDDIIQHLTGKKLNE